MNFGADEAPQTFGPPGGANGGQWQSRGGGRGRGGFRGRGRGGFGGRGGGYGGGFGVNRHGNDPQYTADYRIMLHNSAAGTIIGKGGSKIKEIEEQSSCKLKCVGEKMPERVVLIHGDAESATKACSMMAEAIHEQYSYGQNRPPVIMAPGQKPCGRDDVQFGLLLSEMDCGPIIGRQGSRITTYHQETGCQVFVHNEYSSGKTLPQSNEKVVTVTGPPRAIPVCFERIFSVLQEEGRGRNRRRIWDLYEAGPCNFYGDLGPNFGGPGMNAQPAPGPVPGAWNSELPDGVTPFLQNVPFKNESENVVVGLINQEMVTSIIGPRGARIKEIRKMTGCEIIIDDECPVDSVFRTLTIKKGAIEEGVENAKWLIDICVNAFCDPQLSLRPFSTDMSIENAILTGAYGAPPSLDEAGKQSFLQQCKEQQNGGMNGGMNNDETPQQPEQAFYGNAPGQQNNNGFGNFNNQEPIKQEQQTPGW